MFTESVFLFQKAEIGYIYFQAERSPSHSHCSRKTVPLAKLLKSAKLLRNLAYKLKTFNIAQSYRNTLQENVKLPPAEL